MGRLALRPAREESNAEGGEQYEGVIKSFSEQTGFGFISCEQTFRKYGNDVFLHSSQKGDHEVGDSVSFLLHVNKEGKPQASGVMATNGRGSKRRSNDQWQSDDRSW